MPYKKVESFAPLWKPRIGEEVEGIVKTVGKVKIADKDMDQYQIELILPALITIRDFDTEDSTPEAVPFGKDVLITMPAHKMLLNMLGQAQVGDQVKVKCTKSIPSKTKGKNDMNFYEVFIMKTK